MLRQIIILNGPPGSGKDTIAAGLSRVLPNPYHMSFKSVMLETARCITGMSKMQWDERYEDRELKETPCASCGGLSQRQFLIKLSEDWLKPLYGKSFFGDRMIPEIQALGGVSNFIFSDGGFPDEINALRVTGLRIVVVHLYREGCSFANDSRNYVNGVPQTERLVVANNTTVEDAVRKIVEGLK